jgi:hypothetical protein
MNVSGVRGAIVAVLIGAGISGCLSEADGVETEEVGETSQALCSTSKALSRSGATALPANQVHPEAAIDGKTDTFWRSLAEWNASITVDLGKFAVVSKVELNWNARCGTDYDILVSTDRKKWTTVASVRGAGGEGVRAVSGFSQKARYVQLKGITPCKAFDAQGNAQTAWYELRELSVFGDVATNCLKADGAECTSVAECAAGRCGVWFVNDADADGYGTTASPKKYCGETVVPAGYVSSKADCCDTDALAWPGQTELFGTANACGSFDYDCSGAITREFFTGVMACDQTKQTCTVARKGFVSEQQCGASGDFIRSCIYSYATSSCSGVLPTKVQRCR